MTRSAQNMETNKDNKDRVEKAATGPSAFRIGGKIVVLEANVLWMYREKSLLTFLVRSPSPLTPVFKRRSVQGIGQL